MLVRKQQIGALNVTAEYTRHISCAKCTSLKVRVAYGYSIRRASEYDIQNRNSCIAYWCGGVAYRCISVLVRNYVDVRGAK